MDNRIAALLGALDAGGDLFDESVVRQANAVLDRAGERRNLGPNRVVVAVTGSTGSGKSSLVNALAGQQVCPVGVLRPTTEQPHAVVWPQVETEQAELLDDGKTSDDGWPPDDAGPAVGSDAGPLDDAGPLLDWLEVDTRTNINDEPAGLILLDLPDIDSIVAANRATADRLVELTDVLLWVVDPEKYADAVVHNHYLRPMAALAPVSIIVLNQIDRLDATELPIVLTNLGEILAEEGLGEVPVLPVAAIDGTGVEAVREQLTTLAGERSAAERRLMAEIRAAGAAVAADVAGGTAGRLGGTQITETTEYLAAAAGVPAVANAVRRDYRRRARLAAGWPLTRWLERFRPDPLRGLRLGRYEEDARAEIATSIPAASPVQAAQAKRALRNLGTTVGGELPQRWRSEIRRVAEGPPQLTEKLDTAIRQTELPATSRRWWSLIGVLHWLALAIVVAGAGWLSLCLTMPAVVAPEVVVPMIGAVPWPTLLLTGGVAFAVALSVLTGLCARIGAYRAGLAAQTRLDRAIQNVLVTEIVHPVNSVVERFEIVRTKAAAAAR